MANFAPKSAFLKFRGLQYPRLFYLVVVKEFFS